jgi:hypothetical protein
MLTRRTIVQTSLAGGMVAGLGGLAAFAHWYPIPDREEQATLSLLRSHRIRSARQAA